MQLIKQLPGKSLQPPASKFKAHLITGSLDHGLTRSRVHSIGAYISVRNFSTGVLPGSSTNQENIDPFGL